MIRKLIILSSEFVASLAGNLVAGWIQQDLWFNLFTPPRVLGSLVAIALTLSVIAWLDS